MKNCIVFLLLATLGMAGSSPSLVAESSKPNIIYLMLDEWGYYEWSGMGHPIFDTPNIDKFAEQGMQFSQFLAGGNVCASTRGVLMTGQHTGHCSIRGNGGKAGGHILRPDDVTVAKVLQDAGYATGGFGKWGCGDRGTTGVPEEHGFDIFYGYYNQVHAHTYYPNYLVENSRKVPLKGNSGAYHEGETFSHELIYQEARKFIREKADQPFFAYLPFTPPHGHWMMPQDDPAWLKYKDIDWDAGMQKGEDDAKYYAAMVELIDRQLGEIIELLKELEIDNNTIIFLCGDNGGQNYFFTDKHPHGFFAPNKDPKTGKVFRGGKGNYYEGGLRIPFLVRWPGKIEAGSTSGHLGYFPDIMPTLAELAGIEAPEYHDGISIVPTLMGESQQQHKYLYWEDNKGNTAVRMDFWKAVRPKGKDTWELYNLYSDIEEQKDLAKQKPEILKQMMAFAEAAHTPHKQGKILDPGAKFQGHEFK